jgi:hypothetical protein
MKKQIVIVGIIILLFLVGFSGCISDNSRNSNLNVGDTSFNHNLGDSMTVGDIKYTFSSTGMNAFGAYHVSINAENIGIRATTAAISVTKYITENGYEYTPQSWESSSSRKDVNPGRTEGLIVWTSAVDSQFLPVVRIHLRVGGRPGILNL